MELSVISVVIKNECYVTGFRKADGCNNKLKGDSS